MGAELHFQEEYNRLRRMATGFMRRHAGSPTASATELVHEAYLRLIRESRDYVDREHFLCTAAGVIRQVIVDRARARTRVKRGGEFQRITVNASDLSSPDADFDILGLQEALTRLEGMDPQQARIVELRFFVGLSVAEVAEVLRISERTVKRDWSMARAWLQRELSDGPSPDATPEGTRGKEQSEA